MAYAGGDLLDGIPLRAEPGQTRAVYADDNGRPVYGGRYEDVDDTGHYITGTSDAEKDEAFYRQLAMSGEQAPQIDRYAETVARNNAEDARGLSLQDRNQQTGSLGFLRSGAAGTSRDMRLLRAGAEGTTDDALRARAAASGETDDMRLLGDAARGNAPSRAEMLGQQMSDRALRAQVSAAGGVRGGPGASAAAYRFASQNAAAQRADMNLGIQAERANELANARTTYAGSLGAARRDYGNLMSGARRDYGQYSGAARSAYNMGTSDLRARDEAMRAGDLTTRGQDIGLATDAARLEAGQRAEDAANRRYYVGLENSTKFGVLANQTGSADAAYNQRMGTRAMENAESAADWNKTKDVVGMASGAVTGGISAGQMYSQYGGGGGGGGGGSRSSGDPYYSSGGNYSGGIYHNDPYSDMNAKQPIVWGSLATMGQGGKSSDGGDGGDGSGVRVMYSDEAAKQAAFVQGVKSGTGQEPPPAKYARSPEVQKHLSDADWHSDQVVSAFGQLPKLQVSGHVTPLLINAGRAGAHMVAGTDAMNTAAEAGQMEAARKAAGRAPRAVESSKRGISYGGADEKPSTDEFQASNPRLAEEPRFTGEPNPLAPSREQTWQYLMSLPPVDPNPVPQFNEKRDVYSDKRTKEPCYSDEKTKEQFGTMSDDSMANAARSMQASPYAYKAQYVGKSGQAPGEVNVGPMAQAMAKDPVASTAVTRDPDSGMLAIDRDKGLKVVMGSLAAQQNQIDELRRRTRRGESTQP